MMHTRNTPEVLRLAAEAGCDPRTAQRALDGQEVRPLVAERIKRAAKKLGMRLPK